MALVLKDRVKQAAAAPGTGTITLGATSTGFQSFASVGNGNTTYFAIVDPVSGDWEVNYGVYTSSGTTLTRNATPLSSSAGGALINFTGAVDVFLTYPSSKAVWQDVSGLVAQQSFGAITATSAALTTGTISTAPVSNTDIVNKQYADAIASGIHFHEAVNLATTAALPANTYNNGTSGVGATLTGNANGALSVDSTLTTASERILVKNEAAGANNGVYTVTQVGSAGTPYILTRATDFDSVGTGVNEIDEGDFFLVTSGTANVNTAWVQQTPPPITIGTTALVFQQFSAPITYTAGTGLSESPTYTFNIANTGTAGTYGSSSFVPVFVTNAQGQVTSVTNTAIAINGSAVSGNISGSAGSVANALTLGTYLTGGTYNGSAAVTATVDATSANTASKVVARDASGNFSAGTITATFSGNTTSATNIAGGAANQIPYQTGSGATSFITAASGTNTVLNFNGSAFTWSAGTISGVPLGSNLNSLTAGTYLTGTAYNGSAAQTWTVNATDANTASTVVARDASGNFSAGTITASLSGNATSATTATSATSAGYSNYLATQDIRTLSPSSTPASRLTFGFTSWANNNTAPYADYLAMRSYGDGSGGSDNLLMLNKSGIGMRVYQQTYGSASAYSTYADVLMTNNYNSYAPSLTGTGASGTWSINITGSSGSTSGNAATATALSSGQTNWVGTGVLNNVVGMLAWKNYNNNHVIFDASQSTSPSGGAVGSTNAAIAWSATYPTLMGWNGSTTYGVRVDSARISDSTSGSAGSVDFANLTNKASGTGTYTTSGDYRAPIFYDSNNTAYYLDPNSSSRLNTIYQAGVYTRSAAGAGYLSGDYGTAETGSTSGAIYTIGSTYQPGSSSLGTMYGIGYAIGNSAGIGFVGDWGLYVASNGTARIFLDSDAGVGYATGSFRAPIFYDSNDTTYYIDPASTSDTALRMRGGALFGPNTTWGAYLAVGGNGNISTSYASVATTDGNLHLDSKSGNNTYLNYYAGSNVYFGNGAGGGIFAQVANDGSFRSPIYYDYNDTAYYVNPASTSILNLLDLSSGKWFNANNESGLSISIYARPNGDNTYVWRHIYGGTGTGFGTGVGGYGIYAQHLGGDYSVVYSPSGFATFPYSARSPIFYDSNNTAYYVDPASTSNLNDVQAIYLESSNSIEMRSSAGGGYPAFLVNQYADVTIYRAGGTTAYIGFSNDNVAYLYNDGTNFIFSGRGLQAPSFGVGTAPSGTAGEIRATNNITAYYSSDIKFKTNVRDIPNAIETVESIGGKLFDWNDEYIKEHGGEDGYFIQKEDFGVIAQDVLKMFPVAVRTRPDGSLAVDYEKLSALAFAAVAELSTRVKSLEARI